MLKQQSKTMETPLQTQINSATRDMDQYRLILFSIISMENTIRRQFKQQWIAIVGLLLLTLSLTAIGWKILALILVILGFGIVSMQSISLVTSLHAIQALKSAVHYGELDIK